MPYRGISQPAHRHMASHKIPALLRYFGVQEARKIRASGSELRDEGDDVLGFKLRIKKLPQIGIELI